jgi:hypothetical protein
MSTRWPPCNRTRPPHVIHRLIHVSQMIRPACPRTLFACVSNVGGALDAFLIEKFTTTLTHSHTQTHTHAPLLLTRHVRGRYGPDPDNVPVEFSCAYRKFALEYAGHINANVDRGMVFDALMLGEFSRPTRTRTHTHTHTHTHTRTRTRTR